MAEKEQKIARGNVETKPTTTIEEMRKGVLNNLTPKPPLPSSVTSSTGQSATTDQSAPTQPSQVASVTPSQQK